MAKCSYKEGICWCIDEMAGFRLTAQKLRDLYYMTDSEIKQVEDYLEYGQEDILVLIPDYNISWKGKINLLKGFDLVKDKDDCYVSKDEDKPLWRFVTLSIGKVDPIFISWQVLTDFLHQTRSDHPKIMNCRRRNIYDKTLRELLYRYDNPVYS